MEDTIVLKVEGSDADDADEHYFDRPGEILSAKIVDFVGVTEHADNHNTYDLELDGTEITDYTTDTGVTGEGTLTAATAKSLTITGRPRFDVGSYLGLTATKAGTGPAYRTHVVVSVRYLQ